MVKGLNLRLYVILSIMTVNLEVIIRFQNGRIKGVATTTSNRKEYWSFRGIYYAESTEGIRRFTPPVSKKFLAGNEKICIAMSGTPLSPWATVYDSLYWAQKLASKVNCVVNNNAELVNCLRNIDATELTIVADKLKFNCAVPFPPTIDGKFLESDPRTMLSRGQIYNNVPVIIGYTRDEGTGIYAAAYQKLMEYSEEFMENGYKTIFNYHLNISKVVEIVTERYFKNLDLSDKLELAKSISKSITDVMCVSHYVTVQYLVAADVRVHAYCFDFEGLISIPQMIFLQRRLGVGHYDDVAELFEMDYFKWIIGDNDVSRKMVSLFTNFASYGDPNTDFEITWPFVSKQEIPVLHIDSPMEIEFMDLTSDSRFDFFTKVIPQAMAPSGVKYLG